MDFKDIYRLAMKMNERGATLRKQIEEFHANSSSPSYLNDVIASAEQYALLLQEWREAMINQ